MNNNIAAVIRSPLSVDNRFESISRSGDNQQQLVPELTTTVLSTNTDIIELAITFIRSGYGFVVLVLVIPQPNDSLNSTITFFKLT